MTLARFRIPEPADEPVPEGLRILFEAARKFDKAAPEWTHKRQCQPELPEVCSSLPRNKQLAQARIRLKAPRPAAPKDQLPAESPQSAKSECPPCGQQPRPSGAQPPWFHADQAFAIDFPTILGILADNLAVPAPNRQVVLPALSISTVVEEFGHKPRTIGRTEACTFISEYLVPLLDAQAYTEWLTELTRTQFYWRGSQPPVPPLVMQREAARDQQLIVDLKPDRATDLSLSLLGRSPDALKLARQQQADDRQLAQERAFLTREASASRGQTPAQIALAPPVIMLKGQPVPSNLYISEVSAAIDPYMRMLYPVIRAATAEFDFLNGPLVGAAYGVLALALVPIPCIYDGFHGTCAMEELLPKLDGSRVALGRYPGMIQSVLSPLIDQHLAELGSARQAQNLQEKIGDVIKKFGEWVISIGDWLESSNRALVMVAARQSGGRVRTPFRATPEGEWEFTFQDQAKQPVHLRTQELIKYDRKCLATNSKGECLQWGGINRDAPQDSEAFWMLTAIWERVVTAAALVNQSGMSFWINAANNRWGGYHPPHGFAHRQGCSIDFDVGLAWKAEHKVPNLQKRDRDGVPLAGASKDQVDCLRGLDRLAAWIGIQAFLLAGVTQYINADAGLLEGATLHLVSRFKIEQPGLTTAMVDPEGHNDHWHFEVVDVPCPPTVLGNPYVFAVRDPGILTRLYALALQRNQSDTFWQMIAGMSKAPTQASDFEGKPEIVAPYRNPDEWKAEKDDWIQWWGRASAPGAGIPLLPVWVDENAAKTIPAGSCWKPKGDYHVWAPDLA